MGSATSRYLLQALLVAAAVTAACAWPAHVWSGSAGLLALGLAAGICLLGAVAGHVAAKAIVGLDPGADDAPARGQQAGIAARLLATLAIALPVILIEPVPLKPFAAWLGVHYLAQLVLEVFVSLRELGQNHGPAGAPARDSQPEETSSHGSDAPPSGPTSDDVTPSEGARQG